MDPSPSFFLLPMIYSTASSKDGRIIPVPARHLLRLHYARRQVMKIIISALLALSVLAGVAAPGPYNPWTDDVGLRSPL
jgi:hypothetical protein